MSICWYQSTNHLHIKGKFYFQEKRGKNPVHSHFLQSGFPLENAKLWILHLAENKLSRHLGNKENLSNTKQWTSHVLQPVGNTKDPVPGFYWQKLKIFGNLHSFCTKYNRVRVRWGNDMLFFPWMLWTILNYEN